MEATDKLYSMIDQLSQDSLDVKEDINSMKSEITSVKENISTTKDDIGAVKQDTNSMKEVKQDTSSMKEDLTYLKRAVDEVKGDMHITKGDVGMVRNNTESMKDGMSSVKGDMRLVKGDISSMRLAVQEIQTKVKEHSAEMLVRLDRLKMKADDQDKMSTEFGLVKQSLQEICEKLEKYQVVSSKEPPQCQECERVPGKGLSFTEQSDIKIRMERLQVLIEKGLQDTTSEIQIMTGRVKRLREDENQGTDYENRKKAIKTVHGERLSEDFALDTDYGKGKKELKEELLEHYGENNYFKPAVRPLVPDYRVEIDDLFVMPEIEIVTHQSSQTAEIKNDGSTKRKTVSTLEELFHKNGKPIRTVYLSGEAGHGYVNECGTISVTQPAIDGKRVLFTFVPNGLEGNVTWKYTYGTTKYDVTNSSLYLVLNKQSSSMLNRKIYKHYDETRKYAAIFTTTNDNCTSEWVGFDQIYTMLDCGILYRHPKRIKHGDEVVLEYFPPNSVLQGDPYFRHLRRKTLDCYVIFGCLVNSSWYSEEYREFNEVYVYRIPSFTDDMAGNYTLQCTNRSENNKATNYVRLFIAVPPEKPKFVNTTNFEGCENCISSKENHDVLVGCAVQGGTTPVFVAMTISGVDYTWMCTFNTEGGICQFSVRTPDSYHLTDIRCEVTNEATDEPLCVTSKFFVIAQPTGPYLYNSQQREGNVNIDCKSYGGRPAPELGICVGGNITNTTDMLVTKPNRFIKLEYLYRDWNGLQISCCMRHPYYDNKPRCTPGKTIDYQYSPESTSLSKQTQSTYNNTHFTETLQCSVHNANPPCKVKWTYPKGLKAKGNANQTQVKGDGGFTTVSTLFVNTTKDLKGENIYCMADCDEFNVTMVQAYKIQIPYASILSTKVSKAGIFSVGDLVVLKCEADSYPSATLFWYDTQNETVSNIQCGDTAICIVINAVEMRDAGIYTCRAETEFFNTVSQYVNLTIQFKSRDELNKQLEETTLLRWLIVGLSILLCIAVVIVVIMVIKMKRNMGNQNAASDNISMNVLNTHYESSQGTRTDTRDDPNAPAYFTSLDNSNRQCEDHVYEQAI